MISDKDTLYVATKHSKEAILEPIFNETFGCKLEVIPNFDTDIYGTFTKERKRTYSQLETAVRKAKDAAIKCVGRYILSSEGSFEADDATFGLLVRNTEVVVLYDKAKDIYYEGWHTSYDVCAKETEIENKNDLISFLDSLPDCNEVIFSYNSLLSFRRIFIKNLSKEKLINMVSRILNKWYTFGYIAQTDMRAHRNEKRRGVIKVAGEECVKEYLKKVA